jgi:lipopolysaccharide transport system ATP-binding protein
MPRPAIEVSGLAKRYVIEHESRHDSLRDTLHHAARKFWRRARWGTGFAREEFWALRDVSFEVQPGEVVGIIGRNGAGKSTLLKILSRITEPTAGRITLRGRVASLLEVGTGFHPDLTGRENVFLNGAILGMSRAEVRRKFDEIVAFAEVEKFLDTPVKRYSSGMYVRLAFAVAAHLEPEILIVDEVLAVGDTQFQNKCTRKIRSVAASGGRTVLLVTHNPSVVLTLCDRALYLKNGHLAEDGEAARIVANYLSSGRNHQIERAVPAGARAAITRVSAETSGGPAQPRLFVRLRIHCLTAVKLAFEIKLHDAVGQPVAFASLGSMTPAEQLDLPAGDTEFTCAVDITGLAAGRYGGSLKLAIPFVEALDELPHCLNFEHEYPAPIGSTHVLQQGWGIGYFTLPARRLD